LHLRIGYYGHPGQQRELNEDSYLILTPPVLSSDIEAVLVVADGMGGHQAGEIASQSLVELLEGVFRSGDYRNMVGYSDQHEDYYVVVLKEVLEWANERLYQLATSHAELHGMGTTVVAVLIAEGRCFWGNVGDSRAYLLRREQLRQFTVDHTWVNEQVSAGLLSWEEALVHPKRNVLTRALGGDSLVRVDRDMFVLEVGDRLLLCSDGLSGVVEGAEIQAILANERDPQQACNRLGTLANQRGGPDNITILIADIGKEGLANPLPDGRVVGPAPVHSKSSADEPAHDIFVSPTPGVTSGGRWHRLQKYLVLSGVLLLGAVLSSVAMLLLVAAEPGNLLALMTGSVVIFSWGALVGRFNNHSD